MGEEKQDRKEKESQLVATIITKSKSVGNPESTILITPVAEYIFVDGKLVTAPKMVEDYNVAVEIAINQIIQRAQMPFNGILTDEEYNIKIYGSAPVINLS